MALTKVSGNVIQDGIVISGIVTATEFEGNLTGTASTATASSTAYGLSGAPDIVVGNARFEDVYITENVGIGTTSPAYKLDVIGDINSSTSVKIKGVDVLEEALRLAIALG